MSVVPLPCPVVLLSYKRSAGGAIYSLSRAPPLGMLSVVLLPRPTQRLTHMRSAGASYRRGLSRAPPLGPQDKIKFYFAPKRS